jgi:hypothetical protein
MIGSKITKKITIPSIVSVLFSSSHNVYTMSLPAQYFFFEASYQYMNYKSCSYRYFFELESHAAFGLTFEQSIGDFQFHVDQLISMIDVTVEKNFGNVRDSKKQK